MFESPSTEPNAVIRLKSIIACLSKAHLAGVEQAEGLHDGAVLVEGITVAIALRRLEQLVQDMLDGIEDAPPVFPDKNKPPLSEIVRACAETFGVSSDQMKKPGRTGGRTYAARQAYFLLSKRIHGSGKSYPQIVRAVGLENHTSAIHGFRTGLNLYQTDRDFYSAVRIAERKLMA